MPTCRRKDPSPAQTDCTLHTVTLCAVLWPQVSCLDADWVPRSGVNIMELLLFEGTSGGWNLTLPTEADRLRCVSFWVLQNCLTWSGFLILCYLRNLLTALILEVLWRGGQFLNSPNGLKQPCVKSLGFPVANKVFHVIYVQLLKMEKCSKLQNKGKERLKK